MTAASFLSLAGFVRAPSAARSAQLASITEERSPVADSAARAVGNLVRQLEENFVRPEKGRANATMLRAYREAGTSMVTPSRHEPGGAHARLPPDGLVYLDWLSGTRWNVITGAGR